MEIKCPDCGKVLDVAPNKKDMVEHLLSCKSNGSGPAYPIETEYPVFVAGWGDMFQKEEIAAIKKAHNHVRKTAGIKEVA